MAVLPADPSEILLTTHVVTYDSIAMGFTRDGTSVTIGREVVKVTSDQSGRNVPIDVRVVGVSCQVKTSLLLFNNVTLNAVFEEATQYTDGGSPESILYAFGRLPGFRLTGKQLRLHPGNLVTSDKTFDIVLHRAVSVEPVELKHTVDEEVMIPVTWEALFDDTKNNTGNKMFSIGDDSLAS